MVGEARRPRTMESEPVSDLVLARIDKAKAYLAEARDMMSVKNVIAMAVAAKAYAQQVGAATDTMNYASEIRLRAERRLGELLREVPKQTGGDAQRTRFRKSTESPPATLADSGISKKLSARAQMLAKVSEAKFEAAIAVEPDRELVTSHVVKALRKEQDGETRKAQRKEQEARQETCTLDDLQMLVKAGKKFGCIYADPPWQYGNQTTRAATDNHYVTMTVDDIAAMPIGQLAADQCHLHLWTTNGFLVDALAILDRWGFEFKSTFIWVKPQLGIGNYWRCSHEIMLLGVKGGLTFPPSGVPSWINADRTAHSAKPEKVRALIEQMSPGPRLELFGRKAVQDWVVFGNEVSRCLFTQEVERMEASHGN